MLTHAENELLTRVEGDAPMGGLMRRSWIPALMSSEIAERDGKPVRVSILGEKLVAFRDTEGRIGVLDEHCPHRRASLALGRNENCGLRCLYHGWKFDVEGRAVEMPSEPQKPQRAIVQRAYPSHESSGFVWIYMGKEATPPPFREPPWVDMPGRRLSIAKIRIQTNWAQVTEGALDSAHSPTLHASSGEYARRPTHDNAPRTKTQSTKYGFRYAAIRTPIEQADLFDYTRVSVYIAPFIAIIPPSPDGHTIAQVTVPASDIETNFYFLMFGDGPGMLDQEAWLEKCGARVGVELDAEFRSILRTRANDYGQDREAMRRGDFTGIRGVPHEDIAMWETMGAIADRTKELLGASDLGIVQFRTRMLNAARAEFDESVSDQRLDFSIPLTSIRSFEGLVPKDVDWHSMAVSPEESELFVARRPIARTSTA